MVAAFVEHEGVLADEGVRAAAHEVEVVLEVVLKSSWNRIDTKVFSLRKGKSIFLSPKTLCQANLSTARNESPLMEKELRARKPNTVYGIPSEANLQPVSWAVWTTFLSHLAGRFYISELQVVPVLAMWRMS